jgi:DNA modification methylase
MIVLGGNMRLKALLEAGVKDVWIDVAEGWTDAQKKEFIIKDNVGFGEWDWDILANEWEPDLLEDWGLDLPDMFEEEPEATEDDYQEPDDLRVDIVKGDLIEIGDHRLLCGDSTDSDQVAKLMNGEKADIMVTDPPYGIDLDTDYSKMGATKTKYEKIKGDDKEFDLTDVISISGTKEQYIWGGDYFVNSLDWMNGTQIIWAKRHSEKENKVFGSAFESLWVSYKCKKQIWFIRPINQSSERLGQHPTQKPIECMDRCIKMSKFKGIIYDSFLGSGSTMVAAHQLNRKCYGMELDPKYCQVIIDRMQKLDPNLEIKVNGKIYGQN